MKKTITLISVGIGITLVIIITILSFSYKNQHIDLHNRYEAENKVVETTLDNMWKTISDKLSINKMYSNDFKEIAKTYANSFETNGEMFKWISTQYPTLDASIYSNLMNTIESERLAFKKVQDKIIDISREHNNLVNKIPSKWFISDNTLLEWSVISSSETQKIMKDKIDNRKIEDLINE